MYVIALGDVFRPGGHQIAALLEQVAAAVGGLYAVADDVRQGEFADFPRHLRLLCGPVLAASSISVGVTDTRGASQ